MAKTPYREDVHGPSAELGGTIAQILDQRFRLQKDLASLKEESNRQDLQGYAIRCIVIYGLTPSSIHERKSLELIRNSLANVMIVTFDELWGRLKEIYKALATDSPEPIPMLHESPF